MSNAASGIQARFHSARTEQGVRLRQYVLDAAGTEIKVALGCGASPKANGRVIWSMSLATRNSECLTDTLIRQIKRLLLPHVPMVICGAGFASCGELHCSLVQSDEMPFSGN
jgi:hypothetical protein